MHHRPVSPAEDDRRSLEMKEEVLPLYRQCKEKMQLVSRVEEKEKQEKRVCRMVVSICQRIMKVRRRRFIKKNDSHVKHCNGSEMIGERNDLILLKNH